MGGARLATSPPPHKKRVIYQLHDVAVHGLKANGPGQTVMAKLFSGVLLQKYLYRFRLLQGPVLSIN
jgi:hypothetical protein